MTDPTDRPRHTDDRISRRDFVRVSALAAGGAVVGACGKSSTGPDDSTDPDRDSWTDPVVVDPTAQVAAVTGTDLASMSRNVLNALGGIQTVVHDGETVFIKPNMVSLPGAPYTNIFAAGEVTKVEICVAVAEECLRAGASEVIIGDGSHAVELPWEHAVTLDGSTNLSAEVARLSAEYGRSVRVASLEADSPEWVEVESDTYLGTIAVSSLVTHADRVISIPVGKTHSWAQLTLSLKNFVGVTPLERYADPQSGIWDRGVLFDHSTPAAIAAIYLDVVRGVQPDLAIVDFSLGVEGNGPNLSHGGRTVDMRSRLGSYLLLASTDLVAADTVAAIVMRHDPAAVVQLAMGYQMDLGECRPDRIEVIGPRLSELRVPWAQAQLRGQSTQSPVACPRFVGRRYPG